MAYGTSANLKVYQAQFNGGFVETQQQNVDAITGGSNGAVVVRSDYVRGDYAQTSFYKKLSNFVIRRDPTSTSAASDIPLTQDENVTVKLHRTIGPIYHTHSAFKQIGATAEVMSYVFGQQAAGDVMAEKLNTALLAVDAFLIHVGTTVTYDNTGQSTKTMTHSALAQGLAKFGDASDRIVCWVMHSKPFFDLIQQSITDKIFGVANLTIVNGTAASLGRPIIVTDSASLINPSSPSDYDTLGLTQGAIDLNDSEVPEIQSEIITGNANLATRIQGEYAYNLGVLGAKWDFASGGANPDATAIALNTNWDASFTSIKQGAGIRIITQ